MWDRAIQVQGGERAFPVRSQSRGQPQSSPEAGSTGHRKAACLLSLHLQSLPPVPLPLRGCVDGMSTEGKQDKATRVPETKAHTELTGPELQRQSPAPELPAVPAGKAGGAAGVSGSCWAWSSGEGGGCRKCCRPALPIRFRTGLFITFPAGRVQHSPGPTASGLVWLGPAWGSACSGLGRPDVRHGFPQLCSRLLSVGCTTV